jgi:excisionase family DNA binding protein
MDGSPAREADAFDLRYPGGRMMNSGGAKIPKFFIVKQVSEALDVSPRTVWRWIKNEELVVHRFGGAVRVAEVDLKAFLSQHRAD